MPTTPLHTIHRELGASFLKTGNYEMPKVFTSFAYEYQAATTTAAVFDISHTSKLQLAGPDAPQFLHNISTNAISDLPLGSGCETYFCDARARALFVGWVYHILANGQHALWLETTAGRGEALSKYLDKYLIAEAVEITDVTANFAQLHLAGPEAPRILDRLIGEALPDLQEFQHAERTLGTNPVCHIRRRDQLGVTGFDLVCLNQSAVRVWEMLMENGVRPAGLETWESLRIEAGTPVYGIDFDETRFVMEVGNAARAVSYTKGCFPGQEPIVMARDRAGRVNRSFLGLKILDTLIPTAETRLTADGQEVGMITSSTWSPRLGAPLALGYIHWKHAQTGNRLLADTPKGPVEVEVLGYPPFSRLSGG